MPNRRHLGTYIPGRVGFIEQAIVLKVGDEYLCNMIYREYFRRKSKRHVRMHVMNEDMDGFKDTNLTFANLHSLVQDIKHGDLVGYNDGEYLGLYRPGRLGFETFIERAEIYVDDKGRIYLKSKYRRHSPATHRYGLVSCYNRLVRYDPTRNLYKDRSIQLNVYNTDIGAALDKVLVT